MRRPDDKDPYLAETARAVAAMWKTAYADDFPSDQRLEILCRVFTIAFLKLAYENGHVAHADLRALLVRTATRIVNECRDPTGLADDPTVELILQAGREGVGDPTGLALKALRSRLDGRRRPRSKPTAAATIDARTRRRLRQAGVVL